jgi:PUA domain protein
MVKHRHTLKKKEAKKMMEILEKTMACTINPSTVEIVKTPRYEFLLFDGKPDAIKLTNQVFLSLQGLMKYRPKKRWVTIDMGAVSHIANGADVMAPGIIDADNDIQLENMVWIRDEKNNHPLAVGISLMTGSEMITKKEGKAVKVIHYVGDDMWNIGESL